MKRVKFIFLRFNFLLIIYSFLLPSCNTYHRNNSHAEVALSSIRKGESLAKTYCQSCHMLPDPLLLDSKSWEKGVLPEMGPRLGIFSYNYMSYPFVHDNYIGKNFYPQKPLLDVSQWQNIVDYYTSVSPDSLPAQKRDQEIITNLSLFKVEAPLNTYTDAATTYVKFNPVDTVHSIIISDAKKQKVYFFNRDLKMTDSVNKTGPIVDIDFNKNTLLACNIGVLNPNNGKFGEAEILTKDKSGHYQKDSLPLFDSLQRPVQITPADFNNDGKTDYLVCEFGYTTGSLSWEENFGSNKFKKHIIRNIPGAIKTYVQDYNHDGLPDIWALFAQGEEGIFLLTNKGNGNFDQEEVLRFPPANGSSYFEFDDFNNDGYPDILYTCGDNADYSIVLKPYHGIYIFLNDKTNHFTQKYFFPVNGCYKAIAKDYDGDGDLDIAAISFFADYARQPEEGFIYLKNNGNFKFQPYSTKEATSGRWLTMDAGDVDGDGKTDLILGNFSIGPSMMKNKTNWKEAPPFIILKNMGVHQ